jgi:hypothetical protein
MRRARDHRRLLSILAFGLLALVADLAGSSLTHRIDVGRHVRSPSYSSADYYPILLAAVKVGIALLLARLVWRAAKAHITERAARRVMVAVGARPRLRLTLSARLWLAFFLVPSVTYLVHAHVEQASDGGRWALVAPWLHSSALPVFAVLAVLMAVAWSAVQGWLADYERYAAEATEQARRLTAATLKDVVFPVADLLTAPRRLFGLSFESRPPPARA